MEDKHFINRHQTLVMVSRRRQRHPSMEGALPDNLMLEVLSRLPVKSIMYWKCVCKKWRDLLSDPYFVRLHLSRSSEALSVHENRTWPGSLVWVEIDHLVPVKSISLKFCARINLLATPQMGSVNGLVCCSHGFDDIYILNPVLEEYMNIPKPLLTCVVGYGFGVSMAGEYKVIRLCGSIACSELYDIPEIYKVEIEVYTLGTEEWRVLGETPYCFSTGGVPEEPGLSVNSHVYWLNDGGVYDFDLNKETFELSPSPPEPPGEPRQTLGVLKGRLSLLFWCSLGLEVWVMKETSWCKEITIQNPVLPSRWCNKPLCLTDGLRGTSILMVHDRSKKELVAYCLNTNNVVHQNLHACNIDTITTYRPSFIKLDNFGLGTVYAL